LKALHVRVVPVTLKEGNVALTAFLRFGKGRHSAGLNIADCFAYALAKTRDLPLLFKGSDFVKTDIVPAWRP
jgi:ribonuclease VapC